jgi:hypothetical protein
VTTTTTGTNAMWDAVRNLARPSTYPYDHGALQIGAPSNDPNWWKPGVGRHDLVTRYAWTITSPDTVTFVAQHAGPRVVDPMAGTGWWAHLLTHAGVDVHAADLHAPGSAANHWHRNPHTWTTVQAADGPDTVRSYGTGRTLLLAWPPHDDPAGADIIAAYPGNRVVYIGEGPGGCCGNDRMFDLLNNGWAVVAEHRPVQWYGIHDYVTVYDRSL